MTLLVLLLLSPPSLLSPRGANSLPPGDRVPAHAASIVQDEGLVLAANDPDGVAKVTGEKSTDNEKAPRSRLALDHALERWRAIRASDTRWTSEILAFYVRSPLLRC